MVPRDSLAGGDALSALRRRLHRVCRSNAEEGLQSSIFDGIWPYGTGETGDLIFLSTRKRRVAVVASDDGAIWPKLDGDEGSFR
jgi:hypothetical protein